MIENAILFGTFSQVKKFMMVRARRRPRHNRCHMKRQLPRAVSEAGCSTHTRWCCSTHTRWCCGCFWQASKGRTLNMPEVLMCGGLSGFVISFVLTPIELVKSRLQVWAQGCGALHRRGQPHRVSLTRPAILTTTPRRAPPHAVHLVWCCLRSRREIFRSRS